MIDVFVQTDWEVVQAPDPSQLPKRERRRFFKGEQARREKERMRPISPLGGIAKELCVPARSSKEAVLYIGDYGVRELNTVEVPFTGYEVVGVRATEDGRPNYDKCDMEKPEITLVTLNAQMTRAQNQLRSCEPDDEECIDRYSNRIELLEGRINTMHRYADRKCYCGKFIARQTEFDKRIAERKGLVV